MDNKGIIEVCFIEEPFIFKVNGYFTVEQLKVLEEDLQQDLYDFNCQFKGMKKVAFEVNYVEGETQYGSGYGDINTIPGYHDLQVLGEVK